MDIVQFFIAYLHEFVNFMSAPITQIFISFAVFAFSAVTFTYRLVQYFRSKPAELFWVGLVALSHAAWTVKLISIYPIK